MDLSGVSTPTIEAIVNKESDQIFDTTSGIEANLHIFKQVLEASGVAMTIRSADLQPIYANGAFLDFYGYSMQEIRETPVQKVLPEATCNLYFETIAPSLNNGESWEGEYLIRTKAGRLQMAWGRFDPVLDETGTLTHVISIMRDASVSMRLRNALTQTERHLKFLSENTSDCLFRIRLEDGKYDYISSAVENITGFSPQEFYETPRLFEKLTPPEWADILEQWWSEFQIDKLQPSYESPLIHKNGSLRWVTQRITLVKDEEGKPIAAEGIITDTTEAKQAQRDLEASEEKFRFLAENITDVIWRMDEELNFTYATPSVADLWGYTPEELVELDYRQLFTPEGLKGLAQAHRDRIAAESRGDFDHINRLEIPHFHKDGHKVWSDSAVRRLYDAKGNPFGYQGITRDISERREAELALRESEARYRLLIETLEDVIWTMGNDFKYTYVSPSIETLTGFTPEEYQRMDLSETMTEASMETVKAIRTKRSQAEAAGNLNVTNRFEIERLRKNGSTVWVESITRRLFDNEGKPTGYLGISRDITERRLAEAAIQEREDRFRTLFEDSPISLWEEDLTRLKSYFDELKEQGVEDFRTYFYENPAELGKCATLVDVVGVNKATLELLRAKSKEDLLGNLDKVLTESSMAAFTEEMILLASGGCEYCGEITHRTLEGDIIWVVVHFLVPPEYEETLSRVIVSLIDVTPRKRAEQALMESEERYRVVVDNAQEGVVVIQNRKPVFVNEAVEEILGYSSEELQQVSPFDVIHPDDSEMAQAMFNSFSSGETEEGFATLRVITNQKETRWVTINIKPITWGGEKAYMKILSDITPHKTLEEELRLAHADMEDRVRQRTAELSQANIHLTEEVMERENAQEHILSLTQQLMRIQEDERQRIARDLHDNVAQDLSSIVLNMETLFDGYSIIDPEILERGKSVADIVRGSIASVRDIAYGLRPPSLDQLGLTQAVERHCAEVSSRTGVDIDFSAVGIENVTLDFDSKINIYRMVQESLNNMSKHAQADKATVRLVASHPNLLIRVTDNGRGFDVDKRIAQAVDERRMGLKSMEERARLIGGSMEIQSRVGSGTRIVIQIPITIARRR